eukprot:1159002-Pelagomonas_calceolata.AAC.10
MPAAFNSLFFCSVASRLASSIWCSRAFLLAFLPLRAWSYCNIVSAGVQCGQPPCFLHLVLTGLPRDLAYLTSSYLRAWSCCNAVKPRAHMPLTSLPLDTRPCYTVVKAGAHSRVETLAGMVDIVYPGLMWMITSSPHKRAGERIMRMSGISPNQPHEGCKGVKTGILASGHLHSASLTCEALTQVWTHD